jgi:hypothetical protein
MYRFFNITLLKLMSNNLMFNIKQYYDLRFKLSLRETSIQY